jgi:competence protein ComEA
MGWFHFWRELLSSWFFPCIDRQLWRDRRRICVELTRPIPPDTTKDKLGRALVGITPGRIFSTLAAVLLVSVGSWWLLRAPAPPVEHSLPMAARPATAAVSAAPPPSLVPADVVVQIAGAVVRPGVYHLPLGSRVGDLVAAAGGPIDGVDAAVLPLAAKVTDGQRIYLPKPGEPVSAAAGVSIGGPSGASAGPVDLNSATVAQLDALPGIGPSTAAAIVAYRDKHGPFKSIDGLLEIKGLGASKVDALRELVRV